MVIWSQGQLGVIMFNDIDVGYLAGFVDGEGTIGFRRMRCELNKSGYKFMPVLEVYNTNYGVLLILQEKFGGIIHTKKNWHGRYKNVYMLRFKPTLQRQLLLIIEPHLIIKRIHAQLLLEYYNIIDSCGKIGTNTFHVYPKIDNIYNRLHVMNEHKPLKVA